MRSLERGGAGESMEKDAEEAASADESMLRRSMRGLKVVVDDDGDFASGTGSDIRSGSGALALGPIDRSCSLGSGMGVGKSVLLASALAEYEDASW